MIESKCPALLLVLAFCAVALQSDAKQGKEKPAKIENLDKKLFAQSEKLLALLKQHKYKNVGVLKFEVQRGVAGDVLVDAPVGRLNALMAVRLENALILANDPDDPIGVVCGAGDHAGPKASYKTEGDRKSLLALDYPRAWGNKDVKVDAFLSGRVQFKQDLKSATVFIKAFDKGLAWHDLDKFEIATTLSLLSEMDLDFVVPRTLKQEKPDKAMPPPNEQELVEKAVKSFNEPATDAKFSNKPKPMPVKEKPEDPPTPSKILQTDVLEFKVFYDDNLITPVAGTIAPPNLKQKVHFQLKSKERIGVVLRVNGVNTVDSDTQVKNPEMYARWILEPDTDYAIYGFYAEKEVRHFKAVEMKPGESKIGLAVADKLGEIRLDVFRQSNEEHAKQRSLACLTEVATHDRDRPATLAELQGRVDMQQRRALGGPAIASRNAILPGDAEKAPDLKATVFHGYHCGFRIITYFTPVTSPK